MAKTYQSGLVALYGFVRIALYFEHEFGRKDAFSRRW
jgi:hypothetical protein